MTSTSWVEPGQPAASTTGSPPRSAILTGVILCLWIAIVVFTATRHEFWRDEVRALSLVRQASSPLDLYRLVQYDGHPALWYLLLYAGTSIADTPLVLPITSVLVGGAAVTLFLIAAPFPFWFRCLVIFSALPLYEYSVMARNYGISALMLFCAAALYPKRATHPYSLAVALALLANTNVHSTMFACFAAGIWAWDVVLGQKGTGRSAVMRFLPLGVVFAGVLAALLFASPRENTILTSLQQSLGVADVIHLFRAAVLRPDETFSVLVPGWLPPKPAILLLYGAIFGLWMRPNLLLAALAAQISLGVFFRLAYPGWYRHQGLYLVFLVFLYWLFIQSARPRAFEGIRRLLFIGGLYVSLLTLVLVDVAKAPTLVWGDITGEKSSSKAFGRFLNGSSEYRHAVIVPEPDFMLESLPYYASNPIYLPRERRFSTTVSWTTASKLSLTLGEVLSTAREIGERTDAEVLIVLGSIDLERDEPGVKTYLYGQSFSWTAAEGEAFRRSTTPVVRFDASEGDEDYRVYALRRESLSRSATAQVRLLASCLHSARWSDRP